MSFDLRPEAYIGSVAYWSNNPASRIITLPNGSIAFSDGVPIGTIYARSAHRRPESGWDHFEETGDISYYTDAAHYAARHRLGLVIRLNPLQVHSRRGQPDGIKVFGSGYLDTRHEATMERYRRWITTVYRAVVRICPWVVFDNTKLGQSGEPRYDQGPGAYGTRAEYQSHNLRLTDLNVDVYGVERLLVFLFEAGDGGRNLGIDYLRHVFQYGRPFGARQDGYGSYSKYSEYDSLKQSAEGAWIFGNGVIHFEQWGGDINAWWTDPVVTRIGPPDEHYRRAREDYIAASVAHMGWTVRMGDRAEQNARSYRRFFDSVMTYAPSIVRARLDAISGDTSPPPDEGPVSTVTVVGGYIDKAIQFNADPPDYVGGPTVQEESFPSPPYRAFVRPIAENPISAEITGGSDIVWDGSNVNFRTTTSNIRVTYSFPEDPPSDDDDDDLPLPDIEERVLQNEEEIRNLKELLQQTQQDLLDLTEIVNNHTGESSGISEAAG